MGSSSLAGSIWNPVALSRSCGGGRPVLTCPALIEWHGFYSQGSEEPKLKWEHITTLVTSLREFVRSTDRKIIATTLSKLKLELDFDSHGISQVQVVLFGFQDAVSVVFLPKSFHKLRLKLVRKKIGWNISSVIFAFFNNFNELSSLWVSVRGWTFCVLASVRFVLYLHLPKLDTHKIEHCVT